MAARQSTKTKPQQSPQQRQGTSNTGQQHAPHQETMPPPQTAQKQTISESERIKNRKHQVTSNIQKKCSDPIWIERLLKIAHGDESKIMRALNSYSTFLLNDQGTGRGDLKQYICEASLSSLFSCFLEAFQMGLDIGGGRDLVSIIVYRYDNIKTAELDVTYKGFVHALNKHFDNAYVQPGLLFIGDEFNCQISDSKATFTHKPKKENLLSQTWDKLEGSYCYFSYTQRDNKETVSRLIVIDKKGIEMIRSKAKQQGVWNDFWDQQTLKSTIRRASKIPFAQIDFGEDEFDPTSIDNRHYNLEDNSGNDRLKLLMDRQTELLNEDEQKSDNKSPVQEGVNPSSSAIPGDTASQPTRGGEVMIGNAATSVSSGAPETIPADKSSEHPNGGDVVEHDDPPVQRAELTDEDFEEEQKP